MKVGDLVTSPLMKGEYGIIVEEQKFDEQISGFLSKRCLYTVSWSSGVMLVGFRQWELEAVVVDGSGRPCKN